MYNSYYQGPSLSVWQVNTLGHFSVELSDKCERRS